MASATWSPWERTVTVFDFPFSGSSATTFTYCYVYKVSLEQNVLTLAVQTRSEAQRNGKIANTWMADTVVMGMNINFYDRNGTRISSSVLAPEHAIYEGYSAGSEVSLWNRGLIYNTNFTRGGSSALLPSDLINASYSQLVASLRSRGYVPQFSETWLGGEPFFKRFFTDDAGTKYQPRPRARGASSWYSRDSAYYYDRPNQPPRNYSCTIPQGAYYYNVTLYGYFGLDHSDYAEFTFPDISEVMADPNFILDPYSKAYIKRGSWIKEPRFWRYERWGRGWYKIYGYRKQGSNWDPL